MERREFIESLAKASIAGVLPFKELVNQELPTHLIKEDAQWSEIGKYFPNDGYINLRSLWTGISPKFIIDNYKKKY